MRRIPSETRSNGAPSLYTGGKVFRYKASAGQAAYEKNRAACCRHYDLLEKSPYLISFEFIFSWSLKDSPSSNSCCRSSSDKSSYPVGYAVLCQCNIEMLQNVILEILHRPFTPDKNKGIPVIQHPHFIRRHQFTATLSSDEFRKQKNQLISF